MDLYRYNKVEFTFIGLDINSEVVRFFNHMTTPLLPISVILSLSQILPTPHKSIVWKEQWGHYRYFSNNQAHLLNLTGH